ncbi:DUF5677 domain-containing protein [Microbispora sp. NBRC 16548]|uniref:DUF5677 domain-containing protein n=1 Tax=Microbispora sp. NBRC 16548 TaxID=3030994 RepID=UPI0024A03B2F|nr:DUF5677 domain-containing protein [Microbispora sp. NBRC 16548]GLX05757.1 hypothetical protein Misp03_26840 [Microbispora sp. NBRC 16548]
MTYEFGNNAGTRKRALPIAKKLIAEAEALVTRGLDVPVEDVALVRVLGGWWVHVNGLAADFVNRIEAGSTIQTTPSYRSIVEHVYKMIWLAQTGDDGLTVIDFVTWNGRRKMIEEMVKQGHWPIPDGVEVGPVPDVDIRTLKPVKDDPIQGHLYRLWLEFENFNKITARFGEPSMYTVYRHLCDYTHPTAWTADSYTEDNGDGTFSIRLNPKPRGGGKPDVLWLPILLMQAGSVVSSKLKGDPFRPVVTRAARDYGVPTSGLIPPSS